MVCVASTTPEAPSAATHHLTIWGTIFSDADHLQNFSVIKFVVLRFAGK
jgi:hypothetical protein